MHCSNCGSEDVKIQVINESQLITKHHSLIWWIFVGWWWIFIKWLIFTIPALIFKIFGIGKKQKIKNVQKKVVVCQKCGKSWNI